MKKRIACLTMMAALTWGGSSFAADEGVLLSRATATNPAYSVQDRAFFTDADVQCDELHQADECEWFRQSHPEYAPGYSSRDRVAYLDDGVNCDELHESDECEWYQQQYGSQSQEELIQTAALTGEQSS